MSGCNKMRVLKKTKISDTEWTVQCPLHNMAIVEADCRRCGYFYSEDENNVACKYTKYFGG